MRLGRRAPYGAGEYMQGRMPEAPGDTKPLSLTLLCEFPRVMMGNLFLQVWDRLPAVCLQG